MVRCRNGRPGHDLPQRRFSITLHRVIDRHGSRTRTVSAAACGDHVVGATDAIDVDLTFTDSAFRVGVDGYDNTDCSAGDAAHDTSGHCAPHGVTSTGPDHDAATGRTPDPPSTTTDDEGGGTAWRLVGAGPARGRQ